MFDIYLTMMIVHANAERGHQLYKEQTERKKKREGSIEGEFEIVNERLMDKPLLLKDKGGPGHE